MGLFDKLRDKVNGFLKTGEVTVVEKDDPMTTKYYEGILSLLSTVNRLTKENIKIFYKVKYDEICDEAALDRALSKFESVVEDERGETWYKLSFRQREKERIQTKLEADEIYEICFKEYMEDVKARFCAILEAIKNQPKKEFLDDGLSELEWTLQLPDDPYPYVRLAGQAMAEVMVDRLLVGDPTVKALVTEEVCTYVCEKKGLEQVYAMVLRAMHFEKFGENSAQYQSITEEDCRSAAMNSSIYQERSSEESPFDKGSVYNTAAYRIMKSEIIEGYSDLDWKRWAAKDNLFVDAACYYALQEMAKYYIDSDTTNVEKSVNLVATYVTSADIDE